MIKFGKDLGVTPIKCTNKEGTEKLKDLHYQVNDILFALNGKLVFKSTATKAYNDLVEAGKSIKALEVPEKANAKKEELLSQLRERCLTLRTYAGNYKEEESDVPAMQKAVNFWLHNYIEAKSALTIGKIASLLADQKELCENIWNWRDQLKVDNFIKANQELINNFNTLCIIKND